MLLTSSDKYSSEFLARWNKNTNTNLQDRDQLGRVQRRAARTLAVPREDSQRTTEHIARKMMEMVMW